MMWGTRILRYVGNREKPEEVLYSPVENAIEICQLRPVADMVHEAMTIAMLREASRYIPNPLFSDYEKAGPHSLFIPSFFSESTEAAAPEPEFEVNLTEALVGWKSWMIGRGKYLQSAQHTTWFPDVPTHARCPEKICKACPTERHTCGIYAVDDPDYTLDGEVLGEVYGWGRYVRGGEGWRAQFAYPKAFHLTQSQVELMERLKIYHVPIYIAQPVRMYDPAEEGYENEHWEAAPHGDSGADQVSASGEEDHQDYD